MKPTPIPAGPLLFCFMGAAMVGSAVWYRLQPAPPIERSFTQPLEAERSATVAVAPLRYQDTVLTIEYAESVSKNSGFSPDRSTFSRAVTRAAPPPKPLEYDPQFVGTMGRGNSLRAMVIWKPGDQPTTHSIGDETPWGVLAGASSSELSFESDGEQRTLKMF